ncbi:Ran-specific GTPase-activating protein 30 [Coemansia thaxteri]|uniref:Ran-specific GTPase-activating protein 30 n=1 Tax=Coemansia thaxteri TaxID=2663907 RepID=A0A9W8BHE0_9FUNG|nr:Ran-specific GTPase-activating protein 30 [Coemansia thaxteri]KAJ2487902.1 Ran-specific GTPase-activating protein 30 [Coemansia sp. RSA 2320]
MDELFSSLALQTVQLVGKAAFGAAGTLALKRVSDYVGHAHHAPEPQAKLERLLARFEARLRIVTPAIDLVEIIAARGHSTLAGALHLTHALRRDMLALGAGLPSAGGSPPRADGSWVTSLFRASSADSPDSRPAAALVVDGLQALLDKIDDAVPLLSLALTTSGAHLGGALPAGVSPARLMQASAVLARAPAGAMVGTPFVLRLYSLFVGSVRPKSRHDFTWKEEYGRCHLGLWRSADADSPFGYELRVLEDTNDGRYHGDAPDAASLPDWAADIVRLSGGAAGAGRSIVVPLDCVASLYYTSAGSLLNIEDSTSPVLVLSVRPDAPPADSLATMADFGRVDVDTRWYALEVAALDSESDGASDSESESGSESDAGSESDSGSADSGAEDSSSANITKEGDMLAQTFDLMCSVSPGSNLSPGSNPPAAESADVDESSAEPSDDEGSSADSSDDNGDESSAEEAAAAESSPAAAEAAFAEELLRPLDFLAHEWNMCTLSLLEYMIRLASVEMAEQASHLEVPDEKLCLYLQAGAGAGASDDAVPTARSAASAGWRSAAVGSSAAATPTPRPRRAPPTLSALTTPGRR